VRESPVRVWKREKEKKKRRLRFLLKKKEKEREKAGNKKSSTPFRSLGSLASLTMPSTFQD